MKLKEIKKKTVADLVGMEYKGDEFYCSNNQLTSLEGAPLEVNGDFDCSDNNLTSLKGAPKKVGRNFWCISNNLTTLEGAPQKVGGFFTCNHNNLTSLKGAPQTVGRGFHCRYNTLLTSLKDIHKHIKSIRGKFDAEDCPIKSHVLGLMLIKDLKKVELDNKEVEAIINSHLDGGSMRSAMECQAELIQAGLEEYAKL